MPTQTAALLELSLERVVARIGDPAPRVYAALFEREPGLSEMFAGDPLGSVRGEMFLRVIDTLVDVAAEQPYAVGMISSEWSNHRMNGVGAAQFLAFFDVVADVFREALGDEWTPPIAAAWRHTLRRVAEITTHAEEAAAVRPS
jgi:hemoglobin-like flavoprotein